MSDIQLTALGDLDVSTGDLVLVTGIDAIVQDMKIRLKFVLGEWHLDQRIGIDYHGAIFVKDPDMSAINSLFSEALRTTPGVVTLNSLTLDLDAATRVLSVAWSAIVTGSDAPLDFTDQMILGGA